MQSIIIKCTGKPGQIPAYQSEFASGADLKADVEGEIRLKPGERKLIPTGVRIQLPPGFEAQVRPRSGLAVKHGIGLLNSPGTIDADYRGEIKVILINLGREDFIIRRGDRIAQMVIAGVTRVRFKIETGLEQTERGEGGFGSTGT